MKNVFQGDMWSCSIKMTSGMAHIYLALLKKSRTSNLFPQLIISVKNSAVKTIKQIFSQVSSCNNDSVSPRITYRNFAVFYFKCFKKIEAHVSFISYWEYVIFKLAFETHSS